MKKSKELEKFVNGKMIDAEKSKFLAALESGSAEYDTTDLILAWLEKAKQDVIAERNKVKTAA